MRRLAQERDLKINEYGVYRGEKSIAGRTEEDVYAALDVAYAYDDTSAGAENGSSAAAVAGSNPHSTRGDTGVTPVTGTGHTAGAGAGVPEYPSPTGTTSTSLLAAPGSGLYGATKHGVLILAEWLRDESEATLDVHMLMPGAVYTPIIARGWPDPTKAPPELGLIMPQRCAELALKGMDLGLFYIPTHPHIRTDIQPRYEGILSALRALDLD